MISLLELSLLTIFSKRRQSFSSSILVQSKTLPTGRQLRPLSPLGQRSGISCSFLLRDGWLKNCPVTVSYHQRRFFSRYTRTKTRRTISTEPARTTKRYSLLICSCRLTDRCCNSSDL